jgi:hypothetical protein
MGTEVMTFSLYDQLVGVPSVTYSVTDLIKYLIEVIGYDACALKRNTQTTYRLVNNASQIYKQINDLIKVVETEDGDTWDDFDKYTGAIDPLEEYVLDSSSVPWLALNFPFASFLFKISTLIEKESRQWLVNNDSITDCLQSIYDWVDNRTKLRAFVKEFQVRSAIFEDVDDGEEVGYHRPRFRAFLYLPVTMRALHRSTMT